METAKAYASAKIRAAAKAGRRGIALAANIAALIALATMAASARSSHAKPQIVVAFGDSYFSGYGIPDSESFPSQLERALRKSGFDVKVINEGADGETISDGLARLDRILAVKPNLIIVELGANDAEQGLDPTTSRADLETILTRIQAAGVPILLCGTQAPSELGPDYQGRFDPIFPEVAAKFHVPLYPIVLDGVSGDSTLVQDDGEHPNPKGVHVMVERMLPMIEQRLR
jgi:acyl-CoA thioesterase-1